MGIREGQYILVAYDETINRWLVIFTYLTEKDWKSAGIGGHTLPIKNVLDNHKKDILRDINKTLLFTKKRKPPPRRQTY